MGIVKAGLRNPGNVKHVQLSSLANSSSGLEKEERVLQGCNAGESDDDCELAEVGCEFVMVGDRICNLPYELYDLPDLKEILSLEVWNLCLTEEERFSLSAYLPDMDQQTFALTMKELLNGEDVFFGSPLKKFFQRLKGGLYSPDVARSSESLQFLQRRGHYYSLKSYHEKMAQTFLDMKKAWSDCQPSIDVDERVRIWKKRKDPKPVCVVDLNAYPAEEEVLTKVDKKAVFVPSSKKMKYTEDNAGTVHVPADVLTGVALSIPKTKPKGVLKIKPIKTNSEGRSKVQALPCDSWGPFRPPPKGVLKIKPKSDPLGQQEKPIALSIHSEPASVEALRLREFGYSPSCRSSFKRDAETFNGESVFPYQEVQGGKACGSYELTPFLQKGEFLNRDSRPFDNFSNSERKIKREKGARSHNSTEFQTQSLPMKKYQNLGIHPLETNEVGDQNSENIRQTSGPWNVGLCPNSTESCPAGLRHSRGKRPKTPLLSGAVSRISAVGVEETFGKSSDHSDYRHREISGKGLLKPSDQSAVSGVPREGLTLPLTYKRKKVHKKHNSLESSLQQPTANASSESRMANGTDCRKDKSVKIKLKIWNDYDTPQYKQGLLNGLQNGSPT